MSRRLSLIAPLLAACSVTACGDGGGPATDDPRVTATQIFPSESRALQVTGVSGGIDVEGALSPSCGPYDWFTSLLSGDGRRDIEFGMYAQAEGCSNTSPAPFSYRVMIGGLTPGPRRFVVHHRWSTATEPAREKVFDDTVTVR